MGAANGVKMGRCVAVVVGLAILGCTGAGTPEGPCSTCGADPATLEGTFYDADLIAILEEGSWSGPVPEGQLPHFEFNGAGRVEVWDGGEPWSCEFRTAPDGNRWKLIPTCEGKNAGIGNVMRWEDEQRATLQLAGTQSEVVRLEETPEDVLARLLKTSGAAIALELKLMDFAAVKIKGNRHHSSKVKDEKKPDIWTEDVTVTAELDGNDKATKVTQIATSTYKGHGFEEHQLVYTLDAKGRVSGVSAELEAEIEDPAERKASEKALADRAVSASELGGLAITARSLPDKEVSLGESWERTTQRIAPNGDKFDEVTTCTMTTLSRDVGKATLTCSVKPADEERSLTGRHDILFNLEKGRPIEVNWSQKDKSKKDDKSVDLKLSGSDRFTWTARPK